MNPLPAEVLDALRSGNKIEAIKRLREASGLGLVEAKDLVDHHEQGITQSHPASKPPSLSRPGTGLSPGEVPRSSLGGAAAAIILVIAGLAVWLYSRFG